MTTVYARWRLLGAFVLAGVLLCRGVVAQSLPRPDPPRPTGGIFAGAAPISMPGAGSEMTLALTGYGGQDDDFNAAQGGIVGDEDSAVGGSYAGFGGEVQFSNGSEQNAFSFNASTELRRYEGYDGFQAVQRHADVNFSPSFGRRWQLLLTQAVDFSPFYQFGLPSLDPTAPQIGTSADSRLAVRDSLNLDSGAELRYRAGERTNMAVRYGYRHSEVTDQPTLNTNRAGITWSHGVSRFGSLRLGYQFDETAGVVLFDSSGQPVFGEPFRLHNIDSGLDYRRPLSFSRRTTVGFSTGLIATQQLSTAFYTISGSATVEHQWGRSWSVNADLYRGMRYFEAIGAPVLDDSVRLRVNGLITRRMEVFASGDYVSGQVNPMDDIEDSRYDNLSATARIRYALSTNFALFIETGLYRYSFGQGVMLPLGFPESVSRRSGRVGLTWLLPVISARTERGTRATR